MNKRYYIIIISLLIVSNLITLLLWSEINEDYYIKSEKLKKRITNLYKINGENSSWRISNTILILSDNRLYLDGGILTYIDDTKLKNISLYNVEIVYERSDKEDILLAKAVSSNELMEFNKGDIINLGEFTKNLSKLDNYNLEKSASLYIVFEYFNESNDYMIDKIRLDTETLIPEDFFK